MYTFFRMGMGSGLPFLPHGDRWRKQRRLVQRYFDPQGVKKFRLAQEQEISLFLEELISAPQDFAHSIDRCMNSLIAGRYSTYASKPDWLLAL